MFRVMHSLGEYSKKSQQIWIQTLPHKIRICYSYFSNLERRDEKETAISRFEKTGKIFVTQPISS